ncbi:hypothetical protein AJ80_02528 [Polytolypa hystricis UAMH7299]|uniref:Uncharacterized protein n=1 Tax=Polytolypa hystricis (strain UAMH7299) TaxID=1447883 RepID=A0A2B7YRB0_POLH7|nr:hypothetical protein AJ80_02528 [Polytolypa hystricis UAMH7299]
MACPLKESPWPAVIRLLLESVDELGLNDGSREEAPVQQAESVDRNVSSSVEDASSTANPGEHNGKTDARDILRRHPRFKRPCWFKSRLLQSMEAVVVLAISNRLEEGTGNLKCYENTLHVSRSCEALNSNDPNPEKDGFSWPEIEDRLPQRLPGSLRQRWYTTHQMRQHLSRSHGSGRAPGTPIFRAALQLKPGNQCVRGLLKQRLDRKQMPISIKAVCKFIGGIPWAKLYKRPWTGQKNYIPNHRFDQTVTASPANP